MTPVAPPNAMVATAGNDRFDDDVRLGLPCVVVVMTVSVALVPWLFPFSEAAPDPFRASVGAGIGGSGSGQQRFEKTLPITHAFVVARRQDDASGPAALRNDEWTSSVDKSPRMARDLSLELADRLDAVGNRDVRLWDCTNFGGDAI